MASDIEYAALAVRKSIVEKFRTTPMDDLGAIAGDRMIAVIHGDHKAEGTRDDLLAAVRKATSFENLWEVLESEGRCTSPKPAARRKKK